MKKLLIVMGAALMLASCNSSNVFLQEWDTPYGIPPFDKIKIGDYMPAIKAGIEQQNAEIQAIIDNQEAPSFENTVAAFDRSGALLEKVTNVLFNVSESDYTPELNAIVEEATPVISAHGDNLMMNPKLFERVKAVYEAPQDNLTREQQMLLKDLYEGFVRNGIGLDEAGQARFKELNSRLAVLPYACAACLHPLLSAPGYRKAVIRGYLLLYRVDDARKIVYIERFFSDLEDYAHKI